MKTQIWIAISVSVLVAILKKELKLTRSLGEILQILSVTLFEKLDVHEALTMIGLPHEAGDSDNQLTLFEL